MPSMDWSSMRTLYFVVFVDIFQVTFILPLLPKIVQTLSPEVTPGFAGTPAEKIGLLAGVAAGAEGIAAPHLGRLADRIGRRPVFMLAQVGSVFSSVVVGLSQHYVMMIVGRVVNGFCGGTAGIAAAYIADITTPEERPGYMAMYMAAMFLGLSVGPIVGGYVNILAGWRGACLAAAGVCFVNLVCTFLYLAESPGDRGKPEGSGYEPAAPRSLFRRLCRRLFKKSLPLGAWLICCSNFLASVGWTVFEAYGVLYIQDTFFVGSKTSADKATTFFCQMIAGAGILGLLVNLFLYPHMEKFTGLKGAIAVGGTLKATGYFGIALAWLGRPFMFSSVQVVAFGDQLQQTSIQTLITIVVKPSRFGEAMGQMTLFGNTARTIGPFAFGPIYERNGKTIPWFVNIFASLIASMLCVAAQPYKPYMTTFMSEGPDEEDGSGPLMQASLSVMTEEGSDPEVELRRHYAEQTDHAMFLGGQLNLARRSVDVTMLPLRRSRSADSLLHFRDREVNRKAEPPRRAVTWAWANENGDEVQRVASYLSEMDDGREEEELCVAPTRSNASDRGDFLTAVSVSRSRSSRQSMRDAIDELRREG